MPRLESAFWKFVRENPDKVTVLSEEQSAKIDKEVAEKMQEFKREYDRKMQESEESAGRMFIG
jgi:predicted metal-binding protein